MRYVAPLELIARCRGKPDETADQGARFRYAVGLAHGHHDDRWW